MVEEYGLDQLRFFLLREVPFGQDGNYSHDAIAGRINSDLANDLGNLAQRSLSMVAKNLGGEVPEPGEFTAKDLAMLQQAEDVVADYRAAFDALAFHRGLESVWRVIASANRYFTAQEPWVLRKTDPERMATVLYVTAEVLRIVAILVQPVMPGSMARLLEQLGQPEGEARMFSALGTRLAPARRCPSRAVCSRATRSPPRSRTDPSERARRVRGLHPAHGPRRVHG